MEYTQELYSAAHKGLRTELAINGTMLDGILCLSIKNRHGTQALG